MNIIRLILSAICFIVILIVSAISSIVSKCNKRGSKKDRIDDIPRYMKRGYRERYFGRHESTYNDIDDAQFHYAIERTNNIMKGGKEHKISKNIDLKKKSGIHKWYSFENWDILVDSNEWNNYITDRKNARSNFFFNWDKVFEKVLPYLDEKYEIIGIIRAENDKHTLYVHNMEKSTSMNSNASYVAGISAQLVKKYADIPGYFLFHTHPVNMNGDPLPSDADIYSCLLDCYSGRYVGHVVIGEYGAIIYFLRFDRLEQLIPGGLLKYFTYCYDLLNAWNSFTNSSGPVNQKERISFLGKWGFDMIVVPSPQYISDSYNRLYLPGVLHDKFTKTKYELLDNIKRVIKKLELKSK